MALSSGQVRTGSLECADLEALRLRLEDDGGVLLEARPAWRLPRLSRPASTEELAVWTRELAALLRSGVPMVDALRLAGEARGTLAAAVRAIDARIREGEGLGDAMSRTPDLFPAAFVAGVRTGELTGQLPRVLERLAEHLEESARAQQRLTAALIYPAILAALALAVLAFLVGYVVPSFAGVLADTRTRLPAVTRMVLAVSELVQTHAAILGVALGTFVLTAWGTWRHPASRLWLDRWMLALPWVGPLLRQAATGAWAQTLSMLAGGAVPLAEALPMAAAAVPNRHLAKRLLETVAVLQEGRGLATAVAAADALSERAVRIVAVGEETGELARMLEDLARLELDAVRRKLELATRVLEPAPMVVMGVAVAVVLVAMFLPIVELAATS